jgi:putative peptidoglycan lipid II flippase
VAILWPDLRRAGFRVRAVVGVWTPMVRRMVKLSVPVALGAGVLQLSVLLDKGISVILMQGRDATQAAVTHFDLLGYSIRYPMELGAPARLSLAQLLYQFPLGIFAIALATAIFPALSADALNRDGQRFKQVLRQGIEASLWEGLPASLGLILVSAPAVRLLFRHGQITAHDAELIALSVGFYAAAIWAFSLQQILNRAYYALHDTVTPLVMSIVTLAVNVLVELPLVWTPLGEAGMAAGTLASFSVQAVVMLWMLDRRVGGLDLRPLLGRVARMVVATAVMGITCWAVQKLPMYPRGDGRIVWMSQLLILISVGAMVYLVTCRLLGIRISQELPRRRGRADSAPSRP